MANKKSTKKTAAAERRPRVATAAEPEQKPAKRYVSGKISIAGLRPNFDRADIIFDAIDHSGVSYEGRVYLNNPGADASTPTTAENGYAGSYHIFGHGGCFGEVGHCEVRGTPRRYDPRPAHPLTPGRKVVIATESIRKALDGKEITVTVVPIVLAGTPLCDYENVVKFDRILVHTYS